MGQLTEDIMEGYMCQLCGVANDDLVAEAKETGNGRTVLWEPPGFPWTCTNCSKYLANV